MEYVGTIYCRNFETYHEQFILSYDVGSDRYMTMIMRTDMYAGYISFERGKTIRQHNL